MFFQVQLCFPKKTSRVYIFFLLGLSVFFCIAALIFAYLFLIEQFLLHCLHVLKIYSSLLCLSICSFYFFRTLLLILGHCLLSSRLILVILSMWSHSCDIVYVKNIQLLACTFFFLGNMLLQHKYVESVVPSMLIQYIFLAQYI